MSPALTWRGSSGGLRKTGWAEREFAGQWGGAGLRGEATYRKRDAARPEEDALRLAFGSDYAFPNTLYLVGEYFYNQGQPALDGAYDPARMLQYTSEIFTLNRHFFNGGIGYDVTPLFRVEGYTVVDAAGPSAFFMPQARYNLTPNTDVTVGAQFFVSGPAGEFHGLSTLFFAELMVSF